ncbi:helix-turn-helix domain-containing protein [Micromonospora sp. SH-82]|uniref:helix-turn-helix domain-containing protein n=1 Tax=Micromonospora sp. SH-82 TaxID=3132938 RepID=UPI003EBD44A2
MRRHWLAREIRVLRREYERSSADLARGVGFPRRHISMLENAQRGPDIDLVVAICDHLQVGSRRREEIISAAVDGWTVGWWDTDAAAMGHRQARYADLESGTAAISEYALALVPGLLQIPEFVAARTRSDPARLPSDLDPAAVVAARARRQELLLASDGPRYEVILDELAVRRRAAEPAIMAAQLRHIVTVGESHPAVTVRVLPIDATIKSQSAPRSAYSIYRYSDKYPTIAVAVDTLTTDLILVERRETEPYRELHSRLKSAALPPGPSIELLTDAAQFLDPVQGKT